MRDKNQVCAKFAHTANDGKTYNTDFYNLDAIISVGYRVNSRNASRFRQWANQVLKDYLLRGYAVNQRLFQLEQKMDNKFASIDRQLAAHKEQIDFFVRTSLPPVEGVFYDGQIFDAYTFAADLIKSANKRIVLIDNYIDETVLTLLDKRIENVSATIYTHTISKELQLDIISIRADHKVSLIKVRDIIYIESAGEYVRLHLADGTRIMTLFRIKNIEVTLPSDMFMRVHRSYIVNLKCVTGYARGRVFLNNNEYVPIGENHKEQFQSYIREHYPSLG